MEVSNFEGGSASSAKRIGPMKGDYSIDIIPHSNYSAYTFRTLNQISKPFQLIISVLKACGNSPISSKRIPSGNVNESDRVVFELNYLSAPTICSAVVGLTNFLLMLLYFLNIGLGHSVLITDLVSYNDVDQILQEEESSDNPIRGMVQLTYLILSLIEIAGLVSRWWRARAFIDFLDEWSRFEIKMAQTFPHSHYHYDFSALVNLRDNLILFYVTYPSMLLIPTWIVIYCSRLNFMVKVITTLIVFQFFTVSLLEDVIVLMSYKSLEQAFHQVRSCIRQFKEMKGTMNVDVATSWSQLVLSIREQCERASKCQKIQEMIRLSGYTARVTLFVYVVLSEWDHALERGSVLFQMSCIAIAGMLLGRIYLKAVMADAISQEEYQVAREIVRIDTGELDFYAFLKLKALIEMITLSPAKICFGNYITLNKRLLLGIGSQIITYLIVLMQFSRTKH